MFKNYVNKKIHELYSKNVTPKCDCCDLVPDCKESLDGLTLENVSPNMLKGGSITNNNKITKLYYRLLFKLYKYYNKKGEACI